MKFFNKILLKMSSSDTIELLYDKTRNTYSDIHKHQPVHKQLEIDEYDFLFNDNISLI